MVTNCSINAPNVANQLIYGTGSAWTSITTANNGVLITSGAGVPSISSTLPNAVQANITTVGTISTGVWNGTTIAIANGGTNATSFTQSAGIVVYDGTRLVNYAGPQINSSGQMTNTSQPYFFATSTSLQTNATGDSTLVTVIYNSASTNRGTMLNTTTGVVTVPVTGRYAFTAGVTLFDLGVANTVGTIRFNGSGGVSNYQFQGNYGAFRSAGNDMVVNIAGTISLTAGDTYFVECRVQNGTKIVDIGNDPGTTFSGYLLAV